MASLFAGTDSLICSALGIQRRGQLDDRALRIEALSEEGAIRLVNELYERMVSNVPARMEGRSEQRWRCRRAADIADRNRSQETILEKAVANLAEHGHMPGWSNQCPVASGIADSHDSRRAVDLVHLSGDTARLIELKWASNTPVHAQFQLLEYGLAYVLARLRKSELRLDDQQLMQVRHTGKSTQPSERFQASRSGRRSGVASPPRWPNSRSPSGHASIARRCSSVTSEVTKSRAAPASSTVAITP